MDAIDRSVAAHGGAEHVVVAGDWRPRFSLTMITFARDDMLRRVLAHLRPLSALGLVCARTVMLESRETPRADFPHPTRACPRTAHSRPSGSRPTPPRFGATPMPRSG